MKAPEKEHVIYMTWGDEVTPWIFVMEGPGDSFVVRNSDVFPAERRTSPASWFYPTRLEAMVAILHDKIRSISYAEKNVEDAIAKLEEARQAHADYSLLAQQEAERKGL